MPSEPTEQKTEQPEKKEWFGLHITSVTPEMAAQLGLKSTEGVVVEAVDGGSVAQEAGLRKGDAILEVNRQRVKDEKDYIRIMEKIKPGQGVLLPGEPGRLHLLCLPERREIMS